MKIEVAGLRLVGIGVFLALVAVFVLPQGYLSIGGDVVIVPGATKTPASTNEAGWDLQTEGLQVRVGGLNISVASATPTPIGTLAATNTPTSTPTATPESTVTPEPVARPVYEFSRLDLIIGLVIILLLTAVFFAIRLWRQDRQ